MFSVLPSVELAWNVNHRFALSLSGGAQVILNPIHYDMTGDQGVGNEDISNYSSQLIFPALLEKSQFDNVPHRRGNNI